MRCSIVSRAGQVLASGRLLIQKDENDELRLDLLTDGGRLLEGGIIDDSGDMTDASRVLFRQFFEVWGMSDVTLTITLQ
ncbi:MAG TPA: hypothetical protein V6C78_13995 [Crinalium sp.]|jgi:hypothetical protein